jgi:hypothetical protein
VYVVVVSLDVLLDVVQDVVYVVVVDLDVLLLVCHVVVYVVVVLELVLK